MLEFAQKSALESLLSDEDNATRNLVLKELGRDRDRYEEVVRLLSKESSPVVRAQAKTLLQEWGICDELFFPESAQGPADSEIISYLNLPPVRTWMELEGFCTLLASWRAGEDRSEEITVALDRMAARLYDVHDKEVDSSVSRAASLKLLLGCQCHFEGDADQYHLPDNSYIDLVLSSRKGLPLTLSLIYIFVARRLGWNAYGLNTPRHYLMAVDGVVMDPFYRGIYLPPETLSERYGARPSDWLDPEVFAATARSTAQRMLFNLINAYLEAGDEDRVKAVQGFLVELQKSEEE